MARQKATRRGSQADFIRASVLTHPLGNQVYDLAVCLGSALLDFPYASFSQFRDQVFQALKPGGHLVIEYSDGLFRAAHMREPREVVEQGEIARSCDALQNTNLY